MPREATFFACGVDALAYFLKKDSIVSLTASADCTIPRPMREMSFKLLSTIGMESDTIPKTYGVYLGPPANTPPGESNDVT